MNSRYKIVLAAVIALVVMTLPLRASFAATFNVNENDDYPLDTSAVDLGDCECESTLGGSGDCTLRAAMQASNACPDASDLIDVAYDAMGYRLTIVGSGEDQAAQGDLDVVRHPTYGASGAKTVTIDLNGNTLKTDFLTGEDRLFDVPSSEDDLTLKIMFGLLQLGEAPSPEKGGCLRALAGTIDLYFVNFEQCAAYYHGGAIYVEDVVLELASGNLGDNVMLTPPNPPVGYDPKGAAIAAIDSVLDIADAELVTNVTSGTGGAIYLLGTYDEGSGSYSGYMTMVDCVVEANGATRDAGGLALFAPFAITDSSSVDNYCVDGTARGAGIHAAVPDGAGSITGSTIDGNHGVYDGGGIFVGGGTLLDVVSSTISYNYGVSNSGAGAAIADGADVAFTRCGFIANEAVTAGGGVAVSDADASFSSSGFASNQSDYGGALYIDDGGAVSLLNVSTSDNRADEDGGAVYNQGHFEALHSTFWLDQCAQSACDVAGIYADGTTTELDRSILFAETNSGTDEHCYGDVATYLVASQTTCFTPDVSMEDDTGMAMCGEEACTFPIVAIDDRCPAESAAEGTDCDIDEDARGEERGDPCDLGAYEYDPVGP